MTKEKYPSRNNSLEVLLNFDGECYNFEDGYWIKFEVRRVEPSKHIPHGIQCSLTLHDNKNVRVLGFDNAHGYKPRKKKYGARKVTWDHKHEREKVVPYEYNSAVQLLEDFWDAVDEIKER
ncbi:MAG: DUF6516 family protein [Syntrophales bacterium]|nr:DUF6516 family protein [Syntrophales bacterium]